MLASLPVLNLLAALLYMAGMASLEGDPRTFVDSLQWAAETLSTTGYGIDGRWSHPVMAVFVITLQFLGVFLVFLVFPIYLIPYLEQRFQSRLPRFAGEISEHAVIYGYGPQVSVLVSHLRQVGWPVLVLDPQEAEARAAQEQGLDVVFRGVDDELSRVVHLDRARVLIGNGTDAENASLALVARQGGYEGEILAFAEEPRHRLALHQAGTDAVFTPRHVLAAALAERASNRMGQLSGLRRLGERLEIREVRVGKESPLAGETLGAADLGGRTGARILGQWIEGHLEPQPRAETEIVAGGILIAAGSAESLDDLEELSRSNLGQRRHGLIVVAGAGEVGGKAAELLREVGEEVLAVDWRERPGVDLVGDILAPGVFDRLPMDRVRTVILALPDDSATLLATLLLKGAVPEATLLARVNDQDSVDRIYRAGADLALSIGEVSSQILARRLLGEESILLDLDLKIRKVLCDHLADRRLGSLDLRRKTGCTVVAVERGEELIVDVGADFRLAAGDWLYISGIGGDVARFRA